MRPIDIKRNKLIEQYMPHASTMARAFTSKYNIEEQYEDYQSTAYEGLCKAAKKFKWRKGISFSHFSSIYITGAMIDEFRKSDTLTRTERLARLNGEDIQNREFISIYDTLDKVGEDCYTYEDILASPEVDYDSEFKKEKHLQTLQEAIETLPKLERIVVCLWLSKKYITYKDMSYILGYSESRVAQIFQEGKQKIKEYIDGKDQRL